MELDAIFTVYLVYEDTFETAAIMSLNNIMYFNKTFTAILFIAFSFIAHANKGLAKTYPAVDVEMKTIKVSEHVYFVQGKAGVPTDNAGFISNAGFIVTTDGVVVFDALGTPSLAARLLAEIRKVTKLPIRYVVVSHYHADHIYGLQVFKEQGAKIIAPQGAKLYLASSVADSLLDTRRFELSPWVNSSTHLVIPDEFIEKDTLFSLGNIKFKIQLIGNAHSQGDLTLLVEPDNVLFSGDLIFEGRVPFVGQANITNWLQALNNMRDINVSAVLPGHGPLAKDPNALINLTYGYLSLLKEKMQTAVKNWVPFAEAYSKIDWSEYKNLPAFDAANRSNTYNVFLFMEQNLE